MHAKWDTPPVNEGGKQVPPRSAESGKMLHCTTPTPPKPRSARTCLTVLATRTRATGRLGEGRRGEAAASERPRASGTDRRRTRSVPPPSSPVPTSRATRGGAPHPPERSGTPIRKATRPPLNDTRAPRKSREKSPSPPRAPRRSPPEPRPRGSRAPPAYLAQSDPPSPVRPHPQNENATTRQGPHAPSLSGPAAGHLTTVPGRVPPSP